MKITILYNNLGEEGNCTPAWGFSALAEVNNRLVLFDAGGDPEVLEKNMQALNFNPREIDYLVISHEHWDHINGLKYLAGKTGRNYTLYIPAKADEHISLTENYGNVRLVEGPEQIAPGVWLTGQMEVNGSELVEQSLVIDFREKLYVVTGCSHPGIDSIVAKVREMFPGKKIALVTGGFHIRDKAKDEVLTISNSLREMGVEKIAPSHCSGDLAIAVFREQWGDDFLELYLGDEYTL